MEEAVMVEKEANKARPVRLQEANTRQEKFQTFLQRRRIQQSHLPINSAQEQDRHFFFKAADYNTHGLVYHGQLHQSVHSPTPR